MPAVRDEIILVYPPLASTSFGKYYPSTAVLAAYLAEAGVGTRQEDLNQQFAEYLLDDSVLELYGTGTLCSVDSKAAAAARWASGHRDVLADPAGCLRAAAYGEYGRTLGALADPLTIDPGPAALLAGDQGASPEILSVYRSFYRHSGIAGRAAGAALVGISVPMGPQLVAALMLAAVLKEADPGLRIVLGGPTMSLMNPADLETLLDQHPAVDAIVRFDGEKPLLELARQVLAGRWDPAAIAGVSARAGGRVRHQPPAAGPEVNRLPYPLYSRELLARLVTPTLAITQARGCYWGKCDYCDFVELFDGSPPFRGRHPDGFVAELEHLVTEYGVDRFTFVTESIPPAFARRMSKLILERGLRIRWTSFAMVDRRFDRSLLELMAQSGCEYLVIGMETTVTRVLKLVHKSADREENIRFLKEASAAGVKLRVNLIPDLPTTTYAEALESLEDIRALADCVSGLAVFPFEPTRSSNVGRNPSRFGLLPLADGEDTGVFSYALNHLQSVDPAMTPEERADVHRRYKEFRSWLNGGGARRAGTAPVSQFPEGTPLRVRTEDLDMVEVDGQIVCHNTRTLDRVAVPPRLAPLLRVYLGGPGTPEVLAHEADPLAQEILPLFLASAGLLAPADETAPDELARLG
jgi:hypothetical protein